MVVIKGDAITAGSSPSFFTKIGRAQPISLALMTVTLIVRQTVSGTVSI